MTTNEVLDLLKEKGLKPTKTGKESILRCECPTCIPKDKKKRKRYVYLSNNPSTKCWICEMPLSWFELTQTQLDHFQTASDNGLGYVQELNAFAKHLPYEHAYLVNELDKNHPCIKFLNESYCFDLDYYSSLGWAYITSAGSINIPFEDYSMDISDTLIFPVMQNNKLEGWQVRFIPGTYNGDRKIAQGLKYMHLFDKGNFIYNYDACKKRKRIVVTEGVKKAVKFPNGTCTWGKGLADRQIEIIQEWDEIVMMLDGEDKTQAKAEEIVQAIRMNGKKILNIDLRKFGVVSPDDLPTQHLVTILFEEWKKYNEKNEVESKQSGSVLV